MTFEGRALTEGKASGAVFATNPLSFWGGYDPVRGVIIDRSHPALGESLAGTILVMPSGRGSSSSSSVLAEAIRLGTAPAAIVLAEPDPILVVGVLVAATLYQRQCPIVVVDAEALAAMSAAPAIEIVTEAGRATLTVAPVPAG